jgi:AraC-like DNA-binding protein
METRPILDIIGLLLSLAAGSVVALTGLRPGGRRPYLSLVFLEVGLYFLTDFITSVSEPSYLSAILSFASALYGLPSLYLFARSFSGEPERPVLIHYIPAILNLPLGTLLAVLYVRNGFVGGLWAAFHIAALEIAQTLQLILYGRSALGFARNREGDWPRRAAIAVICGYGAFIILNWVQFGIAIANDILGRRVFSLSKIDILPVLIALLLAWTLGLCLLWQRDYSSQENREERKYGGRPLPEREAANLIAKVRDLLASAPDLSSKAVDPRSLASRAGEPYYLLSRAVNEKLGMSVSDLVNEYRLEKAKKLLAESGDLGILEVGLEAGFQAKSTFNEVFRKKVGMSPREYREERKREAGTR